MGFTWRRSASVGTFGMKSSSARAGATVDVSGAGKSIATRGTYIHIGAGGVRYSRCLDSPAADSVLRPPQQSTCASPAPGISRVRSVEMLGPTQLVDANPNDLLDEIRRKQQTVGLVLIVSMLFLADLLLVLVLVCSQAPSSMTMGALAVGVLGLISLPWAHWHDRRARLVRVHYTFDTLGVHVQERLTGLFTVLQGAGAIWAVHHEHVHGDWKRNAGAGTSVGRRRVHIGSGAPDFIQTNARVGFLDADGTRLYFFPDRILVFRNGTVSAVLFTELNVVGGSVRFIEDGTVPRDANVIGTTWKFVNKSGGPDRRFSNNYQLPIVRYGTFDVSAASGMQLSLQTSAEMLGTVFADSLRDVRAIVDDLGSHAATPRLEPLPEFADDPPPIFVSASKVLGTVRDLISLRWVDSVPEWIALAFWGILFALPFVATIVRFAKGGYAANLFFHASLVAAATGTGSLVYRSLGRAHQRRIKTAKLCALRFVSLLTNELKSCPLDELDFSALVHVGGVSRSAADEVADDMFRKVVDRFADDGVITEKECAKLNLLATALELSSERSERIESVANAARYRLAVSEVLADGVVTDEEAKLLNRLRLQLGVTDDEWTPGNLVENVAGPPLIDPQAAGKSTSDTPEATVLGAQ